jgi:hypothetical protein
LGQIDKKHAAAAVLLMKVESWMDKSNTTKKKRKLMWFVLLIFAAVAGYFIFQSLEEPPRVISGLPDIDQNLEAMTDEETLALMQDEVDQNNIQVNLKHEIQVTEDGVARIDVLNQPTNAYNVQVDYILKDGNRRVFRSGLIPPNNQLLEAELTEELEAGEHEVTIYYKIFDEDQEINTATFDGVFLVGD